MPILAIIGPHGTGKTDLLKQLEKMVWQPKLIGALSTAELRDELDKTGTALIDEADNIHEAHLIRRYSVETANVSWKESLGDRKWQRHDANIFGATILARRTPFKDTATKSRAIIIATKYRPGSYKSTEVDGRDIMKLAKEVKLTVVSSQRVRDNWSPLQSVAECLGDKAWLEYAEEQIGRDTRALVAAQKVEPEEAILRVLLEEMTMVKLASGLEVDVVLSTIKKKLDGEFDVKLNIPQIQDLLASFGFRLVKPKGYPKVKGNVALVKKLMVERTSPG
jgi:transposase